MDKYEELCILVKAVLMEEDKRNREDEDVAAGLLKPKDKAPSPFPMIELRHHMETSVALQQAYEETVSLTKSECEAMLYLISQQTVASLHGDHVTATVTAYKKIREAV